jgi:hypothetical protein
MTGYHAWALSFILLFFHLPFAFLGHWSWGGEARALGGLALFWATEDFLWFVINPAYGIKRFKKEHVPWHPRWIFYLPLDYWIFVPLGIFAIWYSFR